MDLELLWEPLGAFGLLEPPGALLGLFLASWEPFGSLLGVFFVILQGIYVVLALGKLLLDLGKHFHMF